jgi:hypothetical protein
LRRAPFALQLRGARALSRCFALPTLLALLLVPSALAADVEIAPFSAMRAGAPIAAPWAAVKINDRKKPTRYALVDDDGTVVLHAQADRAAMGLGFPVNAPVNDAPWLRWRWKVAGPVADADPSVAAREDAPARIVLEFDGDRSKLGIADRAVDSLSENLSGRPLPYATLMYIFADRPVGTIVPNPHTKRIQMIVVDNPAAGVGAWHTFTRNIRDDYKKAFNAEPGKLLTVGVLTDTDNTNTKIEAWYGDIALGPAKP